MIYLMWIIVLLVLTLWFGDLLDGQRYSEQRVVGEASGEVALELNRTRDGHYRTNGSINGQSVQFLLDTGASDVNIPENVAKKLQLKPGAPFRAQTANGTITVYATRLNELNLGPLKLRNVRASINPHLEGKEILLGMSALKHLEFEHRRGFLTLRHAR